MVGPLSTSTIGFRPGRSFVRMTCCPCGGFGRLKRLSPLRPRHPSYRLEATRCIRRTPTEIAFPLKGTNMLLPRLPRPGSALAFFREAPWLRIFPILAAVAAALLAIGCSGDRPTEPGAEIPRSLSSEGSVGFLHDDFTASDGTLLQNHTPDGGGDPFTWLPAPAWGFPPAVMEGNAVVARPFEDWVHLTSVQAGDQAELQVEVLALPAQGVVQEIGFWLRTQGADGTHDGAMALWSFRADSSFMEVERPNDLPSVVIQRTGPVGVGLHTLSVEINGSAQFEVRIDGALIGTVPIGTLPPPGYAAMGTWATGTPVARLTSFTAGAGAGEVVRIEPTNGSLEVRPAMTAGSAPLDLKIGVYSAQGVPLPNRTVTLSLTATELTAGHDHEGGKPAGTLSQQNPIETGPLGEVTVKYNAPTPSGPVMIRGTSSGAQEAVKTINVGVQGLETIARSGEHFFFLSSNLHSSNDFYMKPGALEVMERIWKSWVDKGYPIKPSRQFAITAATLVSGGLYDIDGNWLTTPRGHVWHRQGGDLDFDDALAEPKWDEMVKVCSMFEFEGQPVECQLHGKATNTLHFHALLGPNR